jgi:hypothetical protein
VYGVAAAAVLVAGLSRVRPRAGLALVPVILLVCALTVVGMGIGH